MREVYRKAEVCKGNNGCNIERSVKRGKARGSVPHAGGGLQ